MRQHIDSDEDVAKRIDNICQIKGVGLQTVAVLITETNGFALFKNYSQLVSYAGYDVVENQSGNHVGKTKISKKGNSRIRRALHLPAFNVVRYKQKPFIDLFERTLAKHQIKMKSYVSVQKKLLVLVYTLWKKM
ncbi:MAG: IS110 family transposase [Chitinophagia bacterium]|nr:IS110 family transposase [Chitinophagia bacterium]